MHRPRIVFFAYDRSPGVDYTRSSRSGRMARGRRQVTDNRKDDFEPAWSPNWAASSMFRGQDREGRDYDLFVIQVGRQHRSPGSSPTSPGSKASPAWSPDRGRRIAFGRLFEIFTIRPDGSGLRRVTPTQDIPRTSAYGLPSPYVVSERGPHRLHARHRAGTIQVLRHPCGQAGR
ncbi:MAG: hypothetical protein WKF73_03110 [Nocardioidaceae bacterium]